MAGIIEPESSLQALTASRKPIEGPWSKAGAEFTEYFANFISMVNERQIELEEQLEAETASRKAMAGEYDNVYQNFLRNAHARIALSQRALRTDDALKRLSEENHLLHEELALSDELRRQLRKVLRFTTCQLVKFAKLSNTVLTDWCDMESDFHELKKEYKDLLRSYEEVAGLRPCRTTTEKQAKEAEQQVQDENTVHRQDLVVQAWENSLAVPRLIVPPEWSDGHLPGSAPRQQEANPQSKLTRQASTDPTSKRPEGQNNASTSTSSSQTVPSVISGPLPRGYPCVSAVRQLLRPRKLPIPDPGAEDSIRVDVPAFRGAVPMKSWLNHSEKEAQSALRGLLAPKSLPFPREPPKSASGATSSRARIPERDRKGKERAVHHPDESVDEEEEIDIEEEIRQFRQTLDQKEHGWTCEEMDHIRFGIDRINTLYEYRTANLARLVDPKTPENRERLRRLRGEQRDVARVLEEEEGLDFSDLPFPMPEPRFQQLESGPMKVTRLHDVKLELPEPEIDDPTSTTRPWVRLYQEDVNDPRRQEYWGRDNPRGDPSPEGSPDELDSRVVVDDLRPIHEAPPPSDRNRVHDSRVSRETNQSRKIKRGERNLSYIQEEGSSEMESEEDDPRTRKRRRMNAIQLKDDAPYQEQITDERGQKKRPTTAGPGADGISINGKKRPGTNRKKAATSKLRIAGKTKSGQELTPEIIVPPAVAAVFADLSDHRNQDPQHVEDTESNPLTSTKDPLLATIAPVRRSQRQMVPPLSKSTRPRK
ncbi:hypothetical protein FRC14_000014 [Serendipita sp. 396]|nr:hypothetical protein FRC14_000014 [Serendipita sp. 396]KAG8789907.1 hypothetical protein FRC15_000099 [Serendipita sp. 397]KAG8804759.1 hypothetical protein FRC16_000013 [Serendipita sp. 398]KAG8836607.1 hypothetical protein FRC18_011051 [Serendipita sp. 400]KAG8872952.1 hypothetical protein FRC20_008831 [Serendipita sp. 405]